MTSKKPFQLKNLEDGSIEIVFSISWKKFKDLYQKILKDFQKVTEIAGFRKGKAPLKLIEEKIGKQAIYQKIIEKLIPEEYLKIVKKTGIKPIISPQIEIISAEEGKNWKIKAITCEEPKVDLNKYKENLKKEFAAEKIWVPGKDKEKKKEEINQEEKIEKLFKFLLKNCQVRIPKILLEQEVKKMLSRLINQVNSLGLTIQEYLNSQGKTTKDLQEEYRQQAEETLKLEFILSAIANEEKIEISDEDVEKIIKNIPDEKTQKEFQTPESKIYLRHLLKKRQVIDNLISFW